MIKRNEILGSSSLANSKILNATVTLYCVLRIDRFSNRILESVYIERKNAEVYRKKSSHNLHIEAEKVTGYRNQETLWCSNEWGPGDVLSFVNLHIEHEDAYSACYSRGRPSPVKIADRVG
jgi:hypothetical protein